MECIKCKKKIDPHFGCDVCECEKCSRCEKCDVRLCRNCDNQSAFLNWFEKDGIEVYWCEKCIKKHKKKPTGSTQASL